MTTVTTLPAKGVLAAAIVAGDPSRQVPHPDGEHIHDPHVCLLPSPNGGTLIVGSCGLCCYVERVEAAHVDAPVVFALPHPAMAALYACDQSATLMLVRNNGTPGHAHVTITGSLGTDITTVHTEVQPPRDGAGYAELLELLHSLPPEPASRICTASMAPLFDAAQICSGARRDIASLWRAGDHLIALWPGELAIGIATVSHSQRRTFGLPAWAHVATPAE